MGPYTFTHSLLVGFFALAALHCFWHWWQARAERVFIVFAALCCVCALVCLSILVIVTAPTVPACQAGLELRSTAGLVLQPLTAWVFALVAGVRARLFLGIVSVVCASLVAINFVVVPLNGTVTALESVQFPWGETVVYPQRARSGWWIVPIYALLASVQLFGLYAGAKLWARDRVGAALLALVALCMLTILATAFLIDLLHSRLPYVGMAPYTLFVVLLALQLARTYARRSEAVAASEYRLVHALGERVKELTCLHKSAVLLRNSDLSTTDWIERVTLLLPAAWQYPEDTAARVRVGNVGFTSPGFVPTPWMQRTEFTAAGAPGVIEVAYLHEQPAADEGPFLAEERALIDSLAEMLRSAIDRRFAEEALRHSEERYRLIVKHQTEFIVKWRPDGTRTFVNESYCRYFGVREEDCVGTSFFPLITPEFRETIRRKIESITPAAPEATDEHESFTADGERRWQQWTDVGEFDADGRLLELLSTGRDVTERKNAEAQLRSYHERLKALSQQVLHTQETERRRLARELHDEIGQILTAIVLRLHQLKARCGPELHAMLDDDLAVVNRAIEQVREMSLNLRPPVLDVLGLEAALRWYADNQRHRTGLDVQLVGHLDTEHFDPDLEIACFRVVQEALTNVVRHAKATRAWVELRQDENELNVTVRDDGVGFDVAAVQARAGRGRSFGVLSMQERVELLEGRLEIDSAPGRGTRIGARFPVARPAAECPEDRP